MTTRWARVARGTLAAAFAVFVAALFHVAAGGGVPSALAVTVSLALCVPACVLLTGTRRSLWRLCVSVGLSQLIFHALFTLSPAGPDFRSADGSGHLHAGSHLIASAGSTSMSAMPGMPDNGWMWLGHATAALTTVIALRYGEASVWGLLATAAIRIVAFTGLPMAPARPAAPHRVTVDVRPIALPSSRLVIGAMRRRGPPPARPSWA
jgi:hypothetical protein